VAATIKAHIVKQKQVTVNHGYPLLEFGYTYERVYVELAGEHPIEMTRYEMINDYRGRIGMNNSGDVSGRDDSKPTRAHEGDQQA
jgi:class I fructose-bisphosphate aldolase